MSCSLSDILIFVSGANKFHKAYPQTWWQPITVKAIVENADLTDLGDATKKLPVTVQCMFHYFFEVRQLSGSLLL